MTARRRARCNESRWRDRVPSLEENLRHQLGGGHTDPGAYLHLNLQMVRLWRRGDTQPADAALERVANASGPLWFVGVTEAYDLSLCLLHELRWGSLPAACSRGAGGGCAPHEARDELRHAANFLPECAWRARRGAWAATPCETRKVHRESLGAGVTHAAKRHSRLALSLAAEATSADALLHAAALLPLHAMAREAGWKHGVRLCGVP